MTQNLGSPEEPLEMHGEQWQLEVRTTDPANPSADERWIRSDLNGGDKIATLRCGDGTDIPIFPTGTATDSVREAMRFQVNGSLGYAPIAPESEAAFTARRVQHAGQVHAYHDRMEPGSAIPDSGASHQYNTDAGSGSTLTDDIGSLDGSITGASWVTGGAGAGDAYLSFHAVDDLVDLGTASQSELAHFVNNVAGTGMAYIKPNSGDTYNYSVIIGSTSTNNSRRAWALEADDGGDMRTVMSNGDGSWNVVLSATVLNADEWNFIATTYDGSQAEIFHASVSDSWNVTSEGTESAGSGASGDLADNAMIGRDDPNSETFGGGIDLPVTDTTGWTQTELQNWVNDTKGFY